MISQDSYSHSEVVRGKGKGLRSKRKTGESLCNLSVCVRLRPPPPRDENRLLSWEVDGNTVSTAECRPDRLYTEKASFSFNNVFAEEDSTQDVYDYMCRDAVEGVVQGTNCTIFAYGQTNSGKTFTIGGGAGNPGIIEMAVSSCPPSP